MPVSESKARWRLLPLLSVPAVVLVLLGGGWVAGAAITNDFVLSMLLTTLWIGAVGLACLLLFRAHREMWPALAAFLVTAVVAGGYLAMETFLDDEVDEDVVTADAPAQTREPAATKAKPSSPAKAPAPANRLLAQGSFTSLEHDTSGVVKAIVVRGSRRVLTLTDFETDNGPDLYVYLSAGAVSQGSSGEAYRSLGKLKGNVGDQQYEIPRGVDLKRFKTVLIWCKAFSAGFGMAPLRG
jgi:hypothetical protein